MNTTALVISVLVISVLFTPGILFGAKLIKSGNPTGKLILIGTALLEGLVLLAVVGYFLLSAK